MNINSKSLFALLLLGTLAVSCDKNEDEEISPSTIEGLATTNTSSASVVFNETIEGSNPFADAYNIEVGTDYGLTYVTNPVFDGKKAARFEIREDQPLVKTGKRAEVTVIHGTELPSKEMWYSYAIYFPTDYAYDDKQEVINQWFQDRTPATALRAEDDRLYLHTGNESEPDNRVKLELGPIVKGKWETFVFHFIHSHGSDGLVEVWRNGEKKVSRKGGNMYNVERMPKFKVGLYKSAFKYGTSDVNKRVIYFDNIKVGNQYATYSEMVPMPTTSTTTSQQVVSFTVINSVTDKDIKAIRNGETLSLKALGSKRINIRANTNPGTVGSVKMVLTGADTKTRVDDSVPYALFGDDRQGNYYTWIPKLGTYTLKATTYTGDKNNMGSPTGPEYSITFKITN